jgi:hypothetical protein
MAKVLDRLGSRFEEVELQNSKFVKPATIRYDIDGEPWAAVIEEGNTVA